MTDGILSGYSVVSCFIVTRLLLVGVTGVCGYTILAYRGSVFLKLMDKARN